MADEKKKVSIYNKGLRAFKLPGGVVIHPTRTAEVDAEYFAKELSAYPDLIDAATINPATKKKMEDLEAQNAALRERIAKLEEGAKVAEAPAPAPAPEAPTAPSEKGKGKGK